ncbi:hypothetical protein JW992_11440, partial [candidate division KSB1 bacterium]|nr:hypothetical protein [candidate division KSB1 bacterium]
WGLGVTCTGRNLAYRHQDFSAIRGFAATPDTLSGDDDFILQQLAGRRDGSLIYALAPKSHVPATGPSNPAAFLRQKQRHISAGKSYSKAVKIGYSVFHSCNLLLFSLATGLGGHLPLFLALLGTKVALDGLALKIFCSCLGVPLKIRGWLIWEIAFPTSHLLAAPTAFFGHPRWKKR